MAKKLVIPQAQLEAIGVQGTLIKVRFRIISEDRNRVSAWSPVYIVNDLIQLL